LLHTIKLYSIAFKPAESGWGAGKKYHKNYDDIFGTKKAQDPKGEGETGTTAAPDTTDATQTQGISKK
jgi:hypothetical protein